MALGLVLAGYGLCSVDLTGGNYRFINKAGPAALTVILLTGAWRQVRSDNQTIWQPLFWFRVACAAYYGVGALVPYVSNDVTVAYMWRFYNFTEDDVFKIGLINILSVVAVLVTAAVIAPHANTRRIKRITTSDTQQWTLLFAAFLLIGGGAVRYLIVLPWSLGLTDVVPGIVVPIAKSYNLGLYLLVLAGLRGSRVALLLALALVPIELGIGLLTFAKTEVLLTLIFVYLAVLHQKLSFGRALFGLLLVVGVYSQLGSVIHFGRDELHRRTGDSARGSIEERLDILSVYTGTQWQGTERADLQLSLLRLSYINTAALVINWYDVGQPGRSFSNALIVLVPRVIWTEKPVITSVGTDLYTAATGREGPSFSPGLFAEAYWNFGWWGIPIVMVPFGVILAFFSQYSLSIMHDERWLHLPTVLLGVFMGVRVDGFFVADVIGISGMAIVYAMFAGLLERLSSSRVLRYSRA